MWRKLLIICMFGAIPWSWAETGIAERESGLPMERAQSGEARRIALVIGNADYGSNPLGNPANDARAMSGALQSLGFEVMSYRNLDRQRMQEALREFNDRLAAGGVGLFYFAGHGFRVADRTLLMPVDADIDAPARLVREGIDVRTVLENMSGPRPGKLNLVILDTCLNNPFDSSRNGAFAAVPEQTLIAYATAPGAFAIDGARHGLYTEELLKAMTVPGRDLAEVFRHVRFAVGEASSQRQQPWVASSLTRGFRFAAQGGVATGHALPVRAQAANAVQYRAVMPKDSAEQYELTFWESIKDSTHASDYEAYLQAYPNGRFAGLARARIERLRAAAPKAEPKPEAPAAAQPAPAKPQAAEPVRPPPAAKTPREQQRPAPPAKAPPEQARPAPAAPPLEKPTAGTAEGKEIKDCPACPVLIALSRGGYMMGSNSGDVTEKPAHHVTINTPFSIGKYEVTVEQWNACVNDGGACPRITVDSSRKNMPMRDVSWEDAQQYVKWLSKVSGKPYRLPTEAEWEYAARGGTSTRYWWGEQMRSGAANCKECGEPWQREVPVSVGSFAANPFGLYDVNGSVWEWVSDCWHTSYKGAPSDGRAWEEPNCRVRVIRGGSWREGASYMQSSTRFKYDANVRHTQNGFRVVRDIK